MKQTSQDKTAHSLVILVAQEGATGYQKSALLVGCIRSRQGDRGVPSATLSWIILLYDESSQLPLLHVACQYFKHCAAPGSSIYLAPELASLTLAALLLLTCSESPNTVAPSNSSEMANKTLRQDILAVATDLRPFEARLTGGLRYAPCWPAEDHKERSSTIPEPSCGVSALSSATLRGFGELGRRLPRRGDILSSVEDLHARGLWNLLWHGKKNIELAIDDLELALARSAADSLRQRAALSNDLAAAYLLRAQRRNRPYDLILSLTMSQQALAADPDLPEAWFNRAWVLENLSLDQAARDAWQRYLTLDGNSGWAGEAAHHLARLGQPPPHKRWPQELQRLELACRTGNTDLALEIVGRDPQAAREEVERRLLPTWARNTLDSSIGGPQPALAPLSLSRCIGQSLQKAQQNHLISDAVARIESGKANPGALRQLAAGHRALDEGIHLYRQAASLRATDRLRQARQMLKNSGSPFELWASFYLACAIYRTDDYAASLEVLAQLRQEFDNRPYPILEAHVLWMLGLNHFVSGRPLESLPFYKQALALFLSQGEGENAAAIRSMTGDSLDLLGRHQEAWESLYGALRARDTRRTPKRSFQIYVTMADAVLRRGHAAEALLFQQEAVHQANLSGDLHLRADARFWLGWMRHLAGSTEEGRRDLAAAKQLTVKIEDVTTRRRVEADIATLEGSLRAEVSPRQVLVPLSTAITFYREAHLGLQATNMAYRARAQAYRQLGALDRAEQDLRAGIELYEQRLTQGSAEDIRWGPNNLADALFDEMITLQARDRGNLSRAFDFAERARNGEFLTFSPLKAIRPAQSLLHSEVLAALPPQTTLVQWMVLADRLLIWRLRSAASESYEIPMEKEKLQRLVHALGNSMGGARPAGTWEPLAEELYDRLIGPWIHQVPSDDLVVLVPDRTLQSIPFSALRDEHTGRLLIEQLRFVTAPSATSFLAADHRARQPRTRAQASVLVVADPAFSVDRFPGLDRLPGARAEGDALLELYPQAQILTGEEAIRDAVLEQIMHAQRVHFTGHALPNGEHPELSMLVLAPAHDGDAGVLYAQDIYRLDLSLTHLVVLAACETASSPDLASQGVSSLAWAFLQAGSHTVVASLWPIKDRLTALFLEDFHRQLIAGLDPAGALKSAQLTFINSDEEVLRHPTSWAAFRVIGGSVRQPL